MRVVCDEEACCFCDVASSGSEVVSIMIVLGPRSGGVRGFDLCAGDVFQVSSRPFLVAGPGDDGRGPLSVVGVGGRVCSVDECEAQWRTRGVVSEMVRHFGAWRFES